MDAPEMAPRVIAKFAERQRIALRWIPVIDLIDWCAHSTTGASNDQEAKAREVAYKRLVESIRRGEFERGGRSKILYLDTLVIPDSRSPRCRLTREQFEIAYDAAAMPPAPSLPLTVLNCCWLPNEMAGQWLESHGYRRAPHFEQTQVIRSARAIQDFDARLGLINGSADPPPFLPSGPPAPNDALNNLLPDNANLYMPTGAPGRPSKGMYVIRAEFDRRRAEDQCKSSLREEAGALAEWFRLHYATAQSITRKTIENNIRADYRSWKTNRRRTIE